MKTRKITQAALGDHATNIAEWVEFSVTGSHHDTEALS